MKPSELISGHLYIFPFILSGGYKGIPGETLARYKGKQLTDQPWCIFQEMASTFPILKPTALYFFDKNYKNIQEVPIMDLPLYIRLPHKTSIFDYYLTRGSNHDAISRHC